MKTMLLPSPAPGRATDRATTTQLVPMFLPICMRSLADTCRTFPRPNT